VKAGVQGAGTKLQKHVFCGRVGVMAIVGLRGFMIGRTDAMLSTKQDRKTRLVVPDNIQVHKSGSKSTKISTRQRFKIQSQLLYNPLSNSVWLLEAQREAALIKSSQKEGAEHSFDHKDPIDDRSPVGLIGLDQAGWRYRHRFYARTSAPFSNPTSTSQAGDNPTCLSVSQIIKQDLKHVQILIQS